VPAQPLPVAAGRTQRRVGYALGAAGLAAGAVALGYFLWNRDRFESWQKTDGDLNTHLDAPDYATRRIANNALAASIHDASVVNVGIAIGAGALLAGGIALVALAPRAHAAPVPAAVHALRIGPGYVGWHAVW
jgi:hypothetical protein